jgi:serine/threonine-protein kinase
MDARLTASLEGRYTIDREIGRGGMATVYLARDIRHNRNVALKVLNAELGAILGVERFLAEIQVTANLQHPNLLPLFDSGEANGLLFYVMPYVEGESLRAKLEREKQLPVDEAVRIAVSIANALEYAHQHKVIHRDLKPENILMQSGQAVIADFGIALAVSNAGGARITQTGLSLGTPQYMSPEQATGDRVVDGRTDIYSLGAMTYEMLVGDPPHSASTAQAIIAKVMTEKPQSVRVGRPNVSPAADYAIGRALEKLAADRFATAKEFAEALEGRGTMTSGTTYSAAGAEEAPRRGRRELAAWALVVVFGAWSAWQFARPALRSDAPVIREVVDLPNGLQVDLNVAGSTIAVSPAGDEIAFKAQRGINDLAYFVRRIDELAARRLALPASGTRFPTFSPDGRWLAYVDGANTLYKVSLAGGEPTKLASLTSSNGWGLAWPVQDTILVGAYTGLIAVPASGGEATLVPTDTAGRTMGQRWPVGIPGTDAVLFVAGGNSAPNGRLAVLRRSSPRAEVFDLPAAAPLGVVHGQAVYVTAAGSVMAVPFDIRALRPTGAPVQVGDGVIADFGSGAKASLSQSGTLAYLQGHAEVQPVFALGPAAVPLPLDAKSYGTPRLSPDGSRIALSIAGANTSDIWVYDIRNKTLTKLSTEGNNVRPEWMPDGKRVIYLSTRGATQFIWSQPADGSAPGEVLYQPPMEVYEAVMSPDAKTLVLRTGAGLENPRDILIVPLDGERKVVPLVVGPAMEMQPRISPNGKWIVYESNETGRMEIYVRPFPASGSRTQVTSDGATEPIWSRDGRTLYYRTMRGDLASITVTTDGAFTIGARREVISGDYLLDTSHQSYDVAPDGRILLLRRAGGETKTIVVHNWRRELREKTAVKK